MALTRPTLKKFRRFFGRRRSVEEERPVAPVNDAPLPTEDEDDEDSHLALAVRVEALLARFQTEFGKGILHMELEADARLAIDELRAPHPDEAALASGRRVRDRLAAVLQQREAELARFEGALPVLAGLRQRAAGALRDLERVQVGGIAVTLQEAHADSVADPASVDVQTWRELLADPPPVVPAAGAILAELKREAVQVESTYPGVAVLDEYRQLSKLLFQRAPEALVSYRDLRGVLLGLARRLCQDPQLAHEAAATLESLLAQYSEYFPLMRSDRAHLQAEASALADALNEDPRDPELLDEARGTIERLREQIAERKRLRGRLEGALALLADLRQTTTQSLSALERRGAELGRDLHRARQDLAREPHEVDLDPWQRWLADPPAEVPPERIHLAQLRQALLEVAKRHPEAVELDEYQELSTWLNERERTTSAMYLDLRALLQSVVQELLDGIDEAVEDSASSSGAGGAGPPLRSSLEDLEAVTALLSSNVVVMEGSSDPDEGTPDEGQALTWSGIFEILERPIRKQQEAREAKWRAVFAPLEVPGLADQLQKVLATSSSAVESLARGLQVVEEQDRTDDVEILEARDQTVRGLRSQLALLPLDRLEGLWRDLSAACAGLEPGKLRARSRARRDEIAAELSRFAPEYHALETRLTDQHNRFAAQIWAAAPAAAPGPKPRLEAGWWSAHVEHPGRYLEKGLKRHRKLVEAVSAALAAVPGAWSGVQPAESLAGVLHALDGVETALHHLAVKMEAFVPVSQAMLGLVERTRAQVGGAYQLIEPSEVEATARQLFDIRGVLDDMERLKAQVETSFAAQRRTWTCAEAQLALRPDSMGEMASVLSSVKVLLKILERESQRYALEYSQVSQALKSFPEPMLRIGALGDRAQVFMALWEDYTRFSREKLEILRKRIGALRVAIPEAPVREALPSDQLTALAESEAAQVEALTAELGGARTRFTPHASTLRSLDPPSFPHLDPAAQLGLLTQAEIAEGKELVRAKALIQGVRQRATVSLALLAAVLEQLPEELQHRIAAIRAAHDEQLEAFSQQIEGLEGSVNRFRDEVASQPAAGLIRPLVRVHGVLLEADRALDHNLGALAEGEVDEAMSTRWVDELAALETRIGTYVPDRSDLRDPGLFAGHEALLAGVRDKMERLAAGLHIGASPVEEEASIPMAEPDSPAERLKRIRDVASTTLLLGAADTCRGLVADLQPLLETFRREGTVQGAALDRADRLLKLMALCARWVPRSHQIVEGILAPAAAPKTIAERAAAPTELGTPREAQIAAWCLAFIEATRELRERTLLDRQAPALVGRFLRLCREIVSGMAGRAATSAQEKGEEEP